MPGPRLHVDLRVAGRGGVCERRVAEEVPLRPFLIPEGLDADAAVAHLSAATAAWGSYRSPRMEAAEAVVVRTLGRLIDAD